MPSEEQVKRVQQLSEAANLLLHKALDRILFDDPYEDGVPLAVLVDPAVHDPLADDAHAGMAVRMPLAINTIDSTKRPYLLVIGGANRGERVLTASIRIAVEECLGLHDGDGLRPRSICAWLAHSQPQEPNWHLVASAVNQRALVHPPGGQPRSVFRFWDPRVSSELPQVIGTTGWQACLSTLGVQHWWTLAADATLHSVGGQTRDAQANELRDALDHNPVLPSQVGWNFDALQWKALRQLASRNVIAQAATSWGLLHPPAAEALNDIVRRAFEHGLSDPNDRLTFAYVALTYHRAFDRHPLVRQMLEQWHQAGRPTGGFARRVDAWGDDFLQTLQGGTWMHDLGEAEGSQPIPTR